MRLYIVQRCDCRRSAPKMRFLGRRGTWGEQSVYQCRLCGSQRVLKTLNCGKQLKHKGVVERLFDAIFGG